MGDETKQLPIPVGYKLLIELPEMEEKSSGGIVLASETAERERIATVVGRVIAMGDDAYKGENRFPHGPYCQVGDWVMMRAYSGTRFKYQGCEYRLINDDSVDAVVADPKGVQKV